MSSDTDLLRRLARSYGVEYSYVDIRGRTIQAGSKVVLRVLQAMGAPVDRAADVPDALLARRRSVWRRPIEPVVVAWDGESRGVELRLPERETGERVGATVTVEDGEPKRLEARLDSLPEIRSEHLDGTRYVARRLALPDLRDGYHGLTVETGGETVEAVIVSAPTRAYGQARPSAVWGAFLPLYAIRSSRGRGIGDYTDLDALRRWTGGLGGSVVATLPLLAAFLDEPFEPSPYAPVSRLFWSELFLDLERVPELESSPKARAVLDSADVAEKVAALEDSRLVDYREAMALKRRVLEPLARRFFQRPGARMELLLDFLEEKQRVEDYARFRSATEMRKAPWPTWPEPARNGVLGESDFDEDSRRYHLYVQWLAHEQLTAARGDGSGPALYLDLPVGVHPDGYDVWRERETFAAGVSAGAPPDDFFPKGQNWGAPPLHPERSRKAGHRYLRDCLGNLMSHAGYLRIDHVMSLHRLFWIPDGVEAKDGVYVRYPAEELYGVVSLESHRNRCEVIGEDLGTVPPEVRPAMERHGLRRSYVLQFGVRPSVEGEVDDVPDGATASFGTHDLPTFAGFWSATDVADRVRYGHVEPSEAPGLVERRGLLKRSLISYLDRVGLLPAEDADDPRAVMAACLRWLSSTRAGIALVNLEDLWLEPEPQNVPGTHRERNNWRQKARYSFEEFTAMPSVEDILREIDRRTKDGDRA